MFYEILAAVGLNFILKYGSIFNWPRGFLIKSNFFKELFSCSLCLGFWTGVLVAGALYFIKWNDFYYLLPLVSSFCSLATDSVIRVVQTYEMHLDNLVKLSARRSSFPKHKPPSSE